MNKNKLNIAIINLMPDLADYHQELEAYFKPFTDDVELHWLKLQTKQYATEFCHLLDTTYRDYHSLDNALPTIDGLIITGAPVELLDFEQVAYWDELNLIIRQQMANDGSLLGICWGALAVGKLLGVEKRTLSEKLSGVYTLNHVAEQTKFQSFPPTLFMPISTRACFVDQQIKELIKRHKLKSIMQTSDNLNVVVQTTDDKHLLCLGHPEYGPMRLTNEWHRDRKKNPNTKPPIGIDPEVPDDFWRAHSKLLLNLWVENIKNKSLVLLTSKRREADFVEVI
ncbi:MAG: homoserine O-succinyltransferase [Cyanobacteria bacterium P01_F01_bin.116]